MQRGILETALD
jgi:hypothetical protein